MLKNKKSTKSYFYARMVFILLLLVSIAMLCSDNIRFYDNEATAQTSTAPEPNYLVFTDPTYGITIQYPADWQELGEAASATLDRFVPNGTFGTFDGIAQFAPMDGSVYVHIGVEKLFENLTLDEYKERQIAKWRILLPNSQLIEQNRITTAAGVQGYMVVLNGTLDIPTALEASNFTELFNQLIGPIMDFQPINQTRMIFITMQGDSAYLIEYTDEAAGLTKQFCTAFGEDLIPSCSLIKNIEDPFSYYLPIAEEMIDSFRITTQLPMTGINNGSNLARQGDPVESPPINSDDPCSIIDTRLATGEVTLEEYERLRETLNC